MKKKTDPVLPMPEEPSDLADLLRANLDDSSPRRAIEELGFSFSAWNGFNASAPASFIGGCGGYSALVGNSVVLTCDDQTSSHDLLRIYLKAMVNAFDPDDAIAHDGDTLKAAHQAIDAARDGARLEIVDPSALFRYKRGRGFSWDISSGLEA